MSRINVKNINELLNINFDDTIEYTFDKSELTSAGIPHDEETRKLISIKTSEAMRGRKHSEESKEKMRQSKLGKKRPDLIDNKLAVNRDVSAYKTEAFREKMREVAKRRWQKHRLSL